MGQGCYKQGVYASCLAALIVLACTPAQVMAAQPSSLSRWLSAQVVPDLRDRLQEHPRYQQQTISIVSSEGDALSEAIVTILLRNLGGSAGIQLKQPQAQDRAAQAAVSSIDDISCRGEVASDFRLQVAAVRGPGGRDEVRLQLLPQQEETAAVIDSWHWRGRYSAAERAYFKKPAALQIRDGSMAAPWTQSETDAAARALSRDFACALRPQVKTRIALDWHEQSTLPGIFSDTANVGRHLLGSYRELALGGEDADYAVDVRLVRLRENTWQLWLIGAPRRPDLAPIQAVTYFSAAAVKWPVAATTVHANIPQQQIPRGVEPAEFIDVELLDATQTDSGRSRAELQVTLRIRNRAEWPLEYSFTLSGGHFNHCIASASYYRHDRYGKVEGSIDGGQTVVRRLIIRNAEHRPRTIIGMRKCAGFRDLEGFEEFASQGHKVTDFVRWQM